MKQAWTNLLFLHWKIPAEEVQRTLPAGLTVDTFEGAAWVGIVPFFMRGVRPRWTPAIRGLSDFLELNLRTYVFDSAGRPGVWFYSLDCNQSIAVNLARTFFHLPYEHAEMRAEAGSEGAIHYEARRRGQSEHSRYVYSAAKGGAAVEPHSLEFFLIERYLLFAYTSRANRLFCGRVWHSPYRVSAASPSVWSDVPLRQAGFTVQGRAPDHLCTAAPVDVHVYRLQRVQ